MAIIERTRPYETLIRHKEDGSIGAHHSQINEIVKDGAVISASLQAPVSISDATASNPELIALFGQAMTDALADAERKQALLEEARSEVSDLQAKLASSAAMLTESGNKLQTKTEEAAKLQSDLTAALLKQSDLQDSNTAKEARIAQLLGQIENLTAELAAAKAAIPPAPAPTDVPVEAPAA